MLIEDETASSQIEDAKATIMQSAEQIQAATSNQEVEKALQIAKEKIEELRKKMALAEQSQQTLEQAQAQAAQALEDISNLLNTVKNKYGKLLAENEKVARQFETLKIELLELQTKLRTATTIERVREIARAIDAVREKIEILQSKLSLLGRKDIPQHKVMQELEKPYTVPISAELLKPPAAKLTFLNLLLKWKDKILELFFNTLKYFWTDELSGVAFMTRAILVLLALSFINSCCLLWKR
jgi:chromosome segregation ATPase